MALISKPPARVGGRDMVKGLAKVHVQALCLGSTDAKKPRSGVAVGKELKHDAETKQLNPQNNLTEARNS